MIKREMIGQRRHKCGSDKWIRTCVGGKDRNDINCPGVRTNLKEKNPDDDKAGDIIGEDGAEVDKGI